MKQLQQVIATLFVLVTTMVSAQGPSVTLKGKVYDKESQEGIEQAEIRLYDNKGSVLTTVITNSIGEYQLELESEEKRFKVEAKAKDYNQAEVLIDKSKQGLVVDFGLYRQVLPIEKSHLPTIYFDFDSSFLTEKAKEELKQVVSFMNTNPTVKVRVNAHTDTRGSSDYNDWLSSRRAARVKKWLIENGGIEKERIEELYFGKTQLSNSCKDGILCSKEQHQENRRCDFEIVTR
ncbi:OmpA family protein [Myroides guanonis]|uniref:Outer membrane protein OmpA n=1 Tax=Myroides guanonis TaxID=1150112 RepID=A0A1I3L648_9FLAO|nr:OmpA family protein [Myroides guanonis]SFI80254.1 Outer membrane protein OmpA [Myroides guanonis]